MTKLSIIIPAFNERPTVEQLLKEVIAVDLAPLGVEKEIIVVESGSTDGTREVVKDFESKGLVKAIYQPKPRGKGNAVRAAFATLTGDIVLIQDADLEYRVSEYPDLLKPLLSGQTDFVLGSRHLGKGDWHFRKFVHGKLSAAFMNFGNKLCNTLFNILYGVDLTDPTTMFKVFRASCIRGVTFRSDYFELDLEIVGKLIRRKYFPIEIPISYVSRGFDEGKKIRISRDGFLVIYAMFRFRWFD